MVSTFSRIALLVTASAFGPWLWGCGNSCEDASDKICSKACDCGGGKCSITAKGGATISFDSEDDCLKLYSDLGCANSKASDADFDACGSAMDSAKCGDKSKGEGVIEPDACHELK